MLSGPQLPLLYTLSSQVPGLGVNIQRNYRDTKIQIHQIPSLNAEEPGQLSDSKRSKYTLRLLVRFFRFRAVATMPLPWVRIRPEKKKTSSLAFLGDKRKLAKILLLVRESGPIAEFLPCLYVCKAWHEIAVEILYSVVVLTHINIGSFCIAALKRKRKSLRIISMTVALKARWPDGSCPEGISPGPTDKVFFILGEMLRHVCMEGMRSFSLYIDDSSLRHAPGLTGQTPPNFISDGPRNLLKSLPRECQELEIDTSGYEISRETHLCVPISELVRSCRHMRLRIGYICQAIAPLSYPSSTLRSLVINCETGLPISSAQCCNTDTPGHINLKQELCHVRDEYDYFPDIERMEIYERLDPNTPTITVTDILSSTSWEISASQQSAHGCHPDIRDATERAWRTTECGARLADYPGSNTIPLMGRLSGHVLRLSWRQRPDGVFTDSGHGWTEIVPELARSLDEELDLMH
ncbi:hypothetical protein FQN49_003798 [Arthroderma sp. PD_2]|nr:hypothetical protein FQN49_003798 [Arthroderma sp. PD_2]